MPVKIKKLHPAAVMPTYATPGAACFDLTAHTVGKTDDVAFGYTGLAFEIPEGHVMLIFSRSGHGFSHDIRLSNCVGVIDSDYRGEVMVKLRRDWQNKNEMAYMPICAGDRIAQALILPVEQVAFEWADELSDTRRGAGGFGHTGSK